MRKLVMSVFDKVDIRQTNGVFSLSFKENLTAKFWTEFGGQIVYSITKEAFREIILNFGRVQVDIVPFLKLCIALGDIKELNPEVHIITQFRSDNYIFYERGYYLPLLFFGTLIIETKYGELKKISSREELDAYYKKNRLNKPVNEIKKHSVTLVPAQIKILQSNDYPQIREHIQNNIVVPIEAKLKKIIRTEDIQQLIRKVELIAYELILNVLEHAYPTKEKKRYGIFASYRHGLKYSDFSDDLNKIFKNERKASPLIDTALVMQQSDGFLELYIVDCGQGFSHSIQNDPNLTKYKTFQYPIREILRDIFEGVLRKQNTQQYIKSTFSGLNYIGRMLIESKDVFWLDTEQHFFYLGDKTRIQSSAIDVDLNENRQLKYVLVSSNEQPEDGVAICIRMKCAAHNIPDEKYSFKAKTVNSCGALSAYRCGNQRYSFSKTLLIDQRYNMPISYFQKGNITVSHAISGNNEQQYNCIVWIPERSITKNAIVQMVDRLLKSNVLSNDESTLIISDINDLDLISFYHAINNFYPNDESYSEYIFEKIIVISQNWYVCAYILKNGRYEKNDEFTQQYIESLLLNTQSANIGNSLGAYAYFLKYICSILFWKYIEEHNEKNYYITGPIAWGSKIVLSGYLCFDTILGNRYLRNIMIDALRRYCSIFDHSFSLTNLDVITQDLCNSIEHPPKNHVENHIAIGSVLVTGHTYNETYHLPTTKTIHCFIHKNCSTSQTLDGSLLLWTPTVEGDVDASAIWKRLGKTHLIGKITETKYKKRENYVVRSSSELMADFQSSKYSLLNWGHIGASDNHYLIFGSYDEIVKDGYYAQSGLFLYLLTLVFGSLTSANEREQLYDKYRNVKHTFSAWIECLCRHKELMNSLPKALVLLYVQNTENEKIISTIQKALPEELTECFVPLTIYKIHPRSVPINIAPILKEKLCSYFEENSNENYVMLFDSVLQTGKTVGEIDDLLAEIGGKLSHIVTITNCMVTNSRYHIYTYWQTPIPRLGQMNECPMCRQLQVMQKVISQFREEYVSRIKIWNDKWKLSSLQTFHGLSLLPEFTLTEEQALILKTKYPELGDTHIFTLNGLCVKISELFCTSYYNDLIEQICSDRELNLGCECIVALISFQLLVMGTPEAASLCEDLLRELVQAMLSLDYCKYENLSIMGALSITSQDILLLEHVIPEAFPVESDTSKNLDLEIVLAYCIHQSERIRQWADLVMARHHGALSLRLRAIIDNIRVPMNNKDIAKDIHGTLYNEYNNDHQTIFEKFNSGNLGKDERLLRYTQLISRINHINSLFSSYGSGMRNSLGNYNDQYITDKTDCFSNYANESNKVIQAVSVARNELQFLENQENNAEVPEFLSKSVETLYTRYKCMHQYYFVGIDQMSKKALRSFLESQAKSISHEDQIYIDDFTVAPSYGLAKMNWYYWNAYIEAEVKDLILNLPHARASFTYNGKTIKMLICVKFDLNNLILDFINLAEPNDFKEAKQKYEAKPKLSKEQNSVFGVEVLFDNISQLLKSSAPPEGLAFFCAKLSIPAVFPKKKLQS